LIKTPSQKAAQDSRMMADRSWLFPGGTRKKQHDTITLLDLANYAAPIADMKKTCWLSQVAITFLQKLRIRS